MMNTEKDACAFSTECLQVLYFSDARKLFKAWYWAGLTTSENP